MRNETLTNDKAAKPTLIVCHQSDRKRITVEVWEEVKQNQIIDVGIMDGCPIIAVEHPSMQYTHHDIVIKNDGGKTYLVTLW